MRNELFRRIGNVIAFFLIWFGVPLYCIYIGQFIDVAIVWLFLGWLPATIIMIYITEDQ
jgi:hypothetical protein